MKNVWLRRYVVLVVVFTFLLVTAGSLVTSNDAALSIPDWPLMWGKLVPPMEGGIRFEFAHRVLAATVSIFTLILAVWMRTRLAWAALATVVAQALLGGAVVRFFDPKWMSISHACLAELCFGILVAVWICLFDDGTWRSAHTPGEKKGSSVAQVTAVLALFAQTALGAAARHNATTIMPHIMGAGVATLAAMWAGLQVLIRHTEDGVFRRAATILLALTFAQVALGMAAFMGRLLTADDPQPMPLMIWTTVAHVAAGALAFGAAVALALIVYKDTHREVTHGGMAVA